MLRANRHRKLAAALLLLVVTVAVAFAAVRVRDAVLFSRLSAAERQVIGTWTWTTIDAVGRMKMRPDHRFDMWFVEEKRDEDHPDSRSVTHGRWSVEGSQFVYIHDPGQLGGQLQPEEHRIPISDFGHHMEKVR